MTGAEGPAATLRLVAAGSLEAALARALAGGPPVAPLPYDLAERERVVAMLQPAAGVSESDAAAVVATSGSTGRPKGVVLSRAAIRASSEATHARLGGPGSWVLALPEHYVAGLMVVARSLVAGTTCHRVRSDLSDLASVTAPSTGRRYLSLVPTQLVRALAQPATTAALKRFDAILLGGAPADPELLATASDHQLDVVTTYGLSETSGGCVYDGVPLDGVEVDLDFDQRILITGPMVFAGYRLAPELTRNVLSGRTFRTSDRGRWSAGRLVITGRTDDVIITGGLNVDLAQVQRAASAWPVPDGAAVVIIGVPDAEWGTLIVAVTDAPPAAASHADLRDHLRRTLPGHAVPRRLVHVAALPRTVGGKIDRQRLLTSLTSSPDRTRP